MTTNEINRSGIPFICDITSTCCMYLSSISLKYNFMEGVTGIISLRLVSDPAITIMINMMMMAQTWVFHEDVCEKPNNCIGLVLMILAVSRAGTKK